MEPYQTRTWWWSLVTPLFVVVLALVLAARNSLPILAQSTNQWTPFIFALVGVLLYVMQQTRTRRERFEPRYLPDYAFRAFQAVVYLYVIMAIIARTGTPGADFADWEPNLTGLFVGMFIQHVEKAMEGLGQRFEEALTAILSRPLTARTLREKQVDMVALEQKYRAIRVQAEGFAAVLSDPAVAVALQGMLASVETRLKDGDFDAIQAAVNDLAWRFELLKREQREMQVLAVEVAGPRTS